MFLDLGFGVDENFIKIHYYKNVKLFYQDLVDIALEWCQCVSQSKKYHLILEMAVAGSKSCFPFITFFDSHLMVGISQI